MLNKSPGPAIPLRHVYFLLFLVLLFFLARSNADAGKIKTDVSLGAHIGLAPSMGGDLYSKFQDTTLGVSSGIDGISRSMSGADTDKVERLLGAYGGVELKAIFIKYFLIKMQVNFAMNMYGGTGTSLDQGENLLQVEYSMWVVDIPFAIGVSVPFGRLARISLCGGIAFAYGNYSNSFKSSAVNSSASFEGWAFPWLIMLSGEYFFRKDIAISSTVAYYRGSSEVIKSGSDYAPVDFTGFRWNIGFSYYFLDTGKKKEKK